MFFVFGTAPLKAAAAPAAPLKAEVASLKAAAIDVRWHSCTAPDVDAPATGGLVAPRTNTLPPPRFFAPTNQVAGRWNCNACGGLPPRLALLRSLSHSLAASQANAPAIAEKTFCVHAWVAMHTVRVHFQLPSAPTRLLMPPTYYSWNGFPLYLHCSRNLQYLIFHTT